MQITKASRIIRRYLEELASEVDGATVEFGWKSRHEFYRLKLNGQERVKTFAHNAGATPGQLNSIRREFKRLVEEMSK